MRVSALRALGRFGANLDALKALHDAVGMADTAIVEAALDALATAGSKDLTPKILLNVVRTGPPDLRLRAAKLMLALGNSEGVKAVVAKECGDADKEADDRDLQVIAGDRCREVGWWQGAIKYYDRALSLRGNAAQTNLVRVGIARCYARIRRFDDARKKLKEANYPNLRAFADDPDFEAHRDLFK
jgi:tetratricopeptide (TPR) repeat protein